MARRSMYSRSSVCGLSDCGSDQAGALIPLELTLHKLKPIKAAAPSFVPFSFSSWSASSYDFIDALDAGIDDADLFFARRLVLQCADTHIPCS
jgi:hypothetical protein